MNKIIIIIISLSLLFLLSSIIIFSISISLIHNLEKTLSEITVEINKNNKPKNPIQSFTITAYTAHKSETNNNPQLTAIMEKPIPGGTCAVSREFMHWLGSRIYIERIGVRRVNDLMNKRFTNRIDLCVPTKKDAKKFGKQKHNVVFLGR